MIFKQMKLLEVSGYWFLEFLKNHIPKETGEDVIADCLQYNVPAIINRYIPYEYLLSEYGEFFEIVVGKMIAPKIFKTDVTNHLLIDCAINYAK